MGSRAKEEGAAGCFSLEWVAGRHLEDTKARTEAEKGHKTNWGRP